MPFVPMDGTIAADNGCTPRALGPRGHVSIPGHGLQSTSETTMSADQNIDRLEH